MFLLKNSFFLFYEFIVYCNSLSMVCNPRPSHVYAVVPSALTYWVALSIRVNKSANSLAASTCSFKKCDSRKSCN